jgi:hypothetical protein
MKHRAKASKSLLLFLQAIGLLLTMLSTFLGALYIFKGNYLYAFPISILFVVVMYYLVTYFMKEKEKKRRKGYPAKTYYFFIIYGLMSIVVSFFVLHFVNVEFFEKEEIKKIGQNKLAGLEAFYNEYTVTYTAFCDQLKTDAIAKLENRSDEEILKKPPFNFKEEDIKAIKNYPNGEDSAIRFMKITPLLNEFATKKKVLLENQTDFFSKHKSILENWDRLKVSKTLDQLNAKVLADFTELNQTLKNLSAENKKLTTSQAPYIEESLIDKPLLLANKHIGFGSLAVLIVFQLLILLPYFMTPGRQYGSN